MMQITELWFSRDPGAWDDAVERYWSRVPRQNEALERSLDRLDLERLRRLDARGWYIFLRDEYFLWKYTDARRLKTTRNHLQRYEDEGKLGRPGPNSKTSFDLRYRGCPVGARGGKKNPRPRPPGGVRSASPDVST